MKPLKIKKIFSYLYLVIIFSSATMAQQGKDSKKEVIQGEVDLKTSEIITKDIADIKAKNQKIEASIISLQDKLAKNYKNKVKLSIALHVQNTASDANFGIIQLTGAMNHVPVISYDHPLVLEKNQVFPLFEGSLPVGVYEFKVSAVVGQQLKKWPLVLPEGKWTLEKTLKIDAQAPAELQSIEIILTADKKTGIPQFICAGEVECK